MCMQKVQMAVSFIQKSGSFASEHAGETRLSEYLSAVLAEGSESIPSAVARSEVCLWHLSAFDRLLKSVIDYDPTGNVDAKYRAELPQELLDQLLKAREELPASLTEEIGRFAEANLRSNYLADKDPMI